MTEGTERKPRASGHVYAHEDASGVRVLLFGRCETDPSKITYRVTRTDGGSSSQHFDLLVEGQFAGLPGLLEDVGKRPVKVVVTVESQQYSIFFVPDRSTAENALFSTSSGLHGVIIETQSSEWTTVAVIAILALMIVTGAAIGSNTNVKVSATVETPAGGGSVNIEVNGRPPEGGETPPP